MIPHLSARMALCGLLLLGALGALVASGTNAAGVAIEGAR